MSEDRLRDVLREADRAAGSPVWESEGLADRVGRAVRRRRMARRGGAVVTVALGALAVTAVWVGDRPEVAVSGQPSEVVRLQADVARLEAEVAFREQLVTRLLAAEKRRARLAALERQLAGMDALGEVDKQMDRAAFTMVYQADRLVKEFGLRASAAERYRRVLTLFPDTSWAQVARRRLSALNGEGAI